MEVKRIEYRDHAVKFILLVEFPYVEGVCKKTTATVKANITDVIGKILFDLCARETAADFLIITYFTHNDKNKFFKSTKKFDQLSRAYKFCL